MCVLKAMFDEYSAGAILFSLNENSHKIEYLLLRHTSGHWEFPKGNFEFGEDGFETARREIYEETGITDIEFIKDFESKIEYYFKRSDKLVHKRVIFYMARTNTSKVILSSEHDAYAWKEYNEAINQLTYENAKDLLKKAKSVVLDR